MLIYCLGIWLPCQKLVWRRRRNFWGGTFPQECPESPGTADDAVPGPYGIGASEMKAREDWLRWDKATDHLQQLPPPPDLWAQREEQSKVQRRFARLPIRRQPYPSSWGTPGVRWFCQMQGEDEFAMNKCLLQCTFLWLLWTLFVDSGLCFDLWTLNRGSCFVELAHGTWILLCVFWASGLDFWTPNFGYVDFLLALLSALDLDYGIGWYCLWVTQGKKVGWSFVAIVGGPFVTAKLCNKQIILVPASVTRVRTRTFNLARLW